MQTPKRKTSVSVRNQRRAHHALDVKFTAECPNCGSKVRAHSVCLSCGYYRGKKIVDVVTTDTNA